jgi:pumilio family protein 6
LIKHKVQDSKEKKARALQVYEKISGILFKIAHSRVGGRIVQLIIKCADEKVKNRIFA